MFRIAKRVFYAGCVAYTFDHYVWSPWLLAEDSMEPGLSAGNVVLAAVWPWGYRRLAREDVVIARHPHRPKQFVCKRIKGDE